jgi:hypothetical protein
MMMTLMMGSIVNTAVADDPWPTCYPCDQAAPTSK